MSSPNRLSSFPRNFLPQTIEHTNIPSPSSFATTSTDHEQSSGVTKFFDIEHSKLEAQKGRKRILSSAKLQEISQTTATLLPTQKKLPAATLKFTHPEHGSLTIERAKKKANKFMVRFTLKWQKPDGTIFEDTHNMFISNEDDNRAGKSSLGYVNIKFKEKKMRGIGIGYVYHYVAALTAKELGVDYFSIDAGLSEEMKKTCKGLKMNSTYEEHNYELDSDSLIENSEIKIQEKEWAFDH